MNLRKIQPETKPTKFSKGKLRGKKIRQISISFFKDTRAFLECRSKMKDKMEECYNCATPFDGNIAGDVCLVIVEESTNKVICRKCANRFAEENKTGIEIFRNMV